MLRVIQEKHSALTMALCSLSVAEKALSMSISLFGCFVPCVSQDKVTFVFIIRRYRETRYCLMYHQQLAVENRQISIRLVDQSETLQLLTEYTPYSGRLILLTSQIT